MKQANCLEKNVLLAIMVFWVLPVFSQQAVWIQKANFFESRKGAASFTVNGKLYVGTGDEKNDLWEYDPATNAWTQKASLPTPGRSYAVGFSIGNKVYIATGVRKALIYIDSLMADVWEYNTATDNWTKKADFAGGRRARAAVFVLNNKAYVGSGENAPAPIMSPDYPNRTASDFWVFDPAANTWDQVADIPVRRINAVAFSGNGKGFVGTDFYNTYTTSTGLAEHQVHPGDNLQDLWAYDATQNAWIQKGNFPGGGRMGMSAFSIGDTAYTVAGAEVAGNKYWTTNTDIIKRDVWAYNTATDKWVEKPDFPDPAERRYSIAAAIDDKGYYGTGGDNEFWEYASSGIVLPIMLVSFAGRAEDNITMLEWTVDNEQNLNNHEVYKSLDGIAFKKVGEVKAAGEKQYIYQDISSSTAETTYYRLKMVNVDNSFSYSKIVILINNKKGLEIPVFIRLRLKVIRATRTSAQVSVKS